MPPYNDYYYCEGREGQERLLLRAQIDKLRERLAMVRREVTTAPPPNVVTVHNDDDDSPVDTARFRNMRDA